MNKKKEAKKALNKTRLGIGVLILLILITAGTTFAFIQLEQVSLTPYTLESLPGGRIHDVFAGGRTESGQDVYGTRDFSVFAENFGGVQLGVRIQFREYIRIGNTFTTMDINNSDTWNTVRFDDSMNRAGDADIPGTSAWVGAQGIAWQLGHLAGETQKTYMPTFNRINQQLETGQLLPIGHTLENSIFNAPNAVSFADTSGRAVDSIAGTWNAAAPLIHEDVYSILYWQDQQENVGHSAENFRGQTGRPQHDGSFNFWQVNGPTETGTLWRVNESGNLTYVLNHTMTARQTLPAPAGLRIMSLTQWLNADSPQINIWVHDDQCPEGWFYWVGEYSGMLDPATSTSLLLRETFLPNNPHLDYIIRINAQFFSIDDLPEVGYTRPLEQISTRASLIYGEAIDAVVALPDEVGALWTDETGVKWRVLIPASAFHGGLGNALIITENVFSWSTDHGSRAWNSENIFVPFEISNLNTTMNNWFADNDYVTATLRSLALNVSLQSSDGLSSPTGIIGNGQPFPLSQMEAMTFITNQQGSELSRQAQRNGTTANANWWLRTPNSDDITLSDIVNVAGDFDSQSPWNLQTGFRPALWVGNQPYTE